MTVVTPAAVAISAAISFVSIPPVPSFDPRVFVLTISKGEIRTLQSTEDTYLGSGSLVLSGQHQLVSQQDLFEDLSCIDHPHRLTRKGNQHGSLTK